MDNTMRWIHQVGREVNQEEFWSKSSQSQVATRKCNMIECDEDDVNNGYGAMTKRVPIGLLLLEGCVRILYENAHGSYATKMADKNNAAKQNKSK